VHESVSKKENGSVSVGTYLAVDELDVVGALRVAVSGSVFGTSLVAAVFRHATISFHLGEVDGTVETASEVGHVNVESELLVLELEQLIGRVVCHEVDTRADVRASLELESQGITRGGDTVGARVVSTIESAVLSAGNTIGAEGSIERGTGVAVGITGGGVEPAPVRVEGDRTSLGSAATRLGALLPAERRVVLSGLSADLLGSNERNEREERSECGREFHG
jgi:hypothetical protein